MSVVKGAPGRLALGVVTASCVVAVGCTSTAEAPQRLGDPKASAGEGVCGVLLDEELAFAMNASVATRDRGEPETATAGSQPSGAADSNGRSGAAGEKDDSLHGERRGAGDQEPAILPGMRMCTASGDPGGRVSWGVLQDNAERVFERYRQWHSAYVESTRVNGYEALWDDELQSLIVLADGQAFGVRLTIPDPRVPTDHRDADQEAEANRDGEKVTTDERSDAGNASEKERADEGTLDLNKETDEGEAAYLRDQAIVVAGRALERL